MNSAGFRIEVIDNISLEEIVDYVTSYIGEYLDDNHISYHISIHDGIIYISLSSPLYDFHHSLSNLILANKWKLDILIDYILSLIKYDNRNIYFQTNTSLFLPDLTRTILIEEQT